jgi:hypothetical protein
MCADVGIEQVEQYESAQDAAKAYCKERKLNKNL